MTRTPSIGSPLGGSWVVNEDTGSDVSWRAEDESEASEDEVPVKYSPAPAKGGQRRHHRGSPEPELIMPSIDSPRQLRPRTAAPSRKQPQQHSVRNASSAHSAPRPVSKPAPRPAASRSKTDSNDTTFLDTLIYYLSPIFDWIFEVLIHSLKFLKKPISWLVAAYLFAGLVTFAANFLTSSIYTALSPICRIPGASLFDLPMCSYQYTSGAPNESHPTLPSHVASDANPEFSSLIRTQSNLESIQDDTTANSLSLPMSMKRSETSIRDLRQIVKYSSLHARNELVHEFDGFIETARSASYDLQRFNSHVGRAVDITLSTARWTQRVLDDMAYQVSSTSSSHLPSFLTSLFTPFQPIPFTRGRLMDQYLQHTSIISEQITSLITEAQALLSLLQNLEDRLDVIHSIALSSSLSTQVSKDEILTHLWTMLGGNRAQLSKYNNQLKLLTNVGEYRKVAWAHVSGTIIKLQAMGAELEELRTRVDAAGLEKDFGDRKEVPLEVHLEAIQLGVERLEAGRERAREVERGHVRRVLDQADTESRKLEGAPVPGIDG